MCQMYNFALKLNYTWDCNSNLPIYMSLWLSIFFPSNMWGENIFLNTKKVEDKWNIQMIEDKSEKKLKSWVPNFFLTNFSFGPSSFYNFKLYF